MTTIDHTLPTGETLTFTVTLRGCEPGTCAAMVEYPAGVDLSQWSTREAYPMAAIEAAIATATKAAAARFTHCDSYGADANTWEEWHFAIDTVTGSTEGRPSTTGAPSRGASRATRCTSPRDLAGRRHELVCNPRPKVLARVRRDLPAEVRREERWWFLGHVVERLGVATVRLVILRARAGGGDAIHEALLAALRARPVAG
jgi:hypothetical protein